MLQQPPSEGGGGGGAMMLGKAAVIQSSSLQQQAGLILADADAKKDNQSESIEEDEEEEEDFADEEKHDDDANMDEEEDEEDGGVGETEVFIAKFCSSAREGGTSSGNTFRICPEKWTINDQGFGADMTCCSGECHPKSFKEIRREVTRMMEQQNGGGSKS